MGITTSINDIEDVQHRQGCTTEYPFFIMMKSGYCYEKVKMTPISFTRLYLALQTKRALSPYEAKIVQQNREVSLASNMKNLDVEVYAWSNGQEAIKIRMKRDNPGPIPYLAISRARARYLEMILKYNELTVHRSEIDALIKKALDQNNDAAETVEFNEKFLKAMAHYLDLLTNKAEKLKTFCKL
jgi:hypothetical protein